ncbi:hypothetical protein [Citrobacter amalonaticus]|uniref:Uncharacterized protein n=1 Tax=Citrobacter amalonaticus TaxID=35703 RepID=A0A8I0MJ24_CITAM|nr:hypothetical protein [Citrobacter amalonaticus]HAT6803849.1 hypothetical protein [Citrobacter freundii]EKW2928106.1 hypothetical protein [Citrobacter amalonaticus]ELK6624724.1 hypothetical protein [Citrobacter amalonaticus]MBE0127808.1 hypothetical protein [Citrobacter amalonaticus]MBJ9278820.1 hypothetical protein [Citrobacter amalonaticus]
MSKNKKPQRPVSFSINSLSNNVLRYGWYENDSQPAPVEEPFSHKGKGTQIMNSFAPPTRPGKGGDNGSGNSGK